MPSQTQETGLEKIKPVLGPKHFAFTPRKFAALPLLQSKPWYSGKIRKVFLSSQQPFVEAQNFSRKLPGLMLISKSAGAQPLLFTAGAL